MPRTAFPFITRLLAWFFLGVLTGNAQLSFTPCYSTNPPVVTAEDASITFTLQTPLSICALPIGPAILSGIGIGNGTVTTPDSLANPPTFTYTPFANYNGPDTLTWTLIQSNCCDIYVTVPITVTPVNDPPTAQNVSLVVPANTTVVVPLTGSDVDGDALTVSPGIPLHGTVSITLGSNLVTYTPATNYIGPDSFTYFVNDGHTNSNPATVGITVKNGITISGGSLQEGNSGTTNAIFVVSLTAPIVQPVAVSFRTTNGPAGPGTAVAGTDYQAISGTLNFAVGSINRRLLSVPVIGDRVFELNEQFMVQLFSASNAVLVASNASCTILNDDPIVGVSELIPDTATVRVGERLDYSLTWTHPEQWRRLNTIDLLIADDEGAALAVCWKEPEDTFSLFHPNNGSFVRTESAGSFARFETADATLYLQQCRSMGSGPTGPSVTIHYRLSFKPHAAGRTFSIEAFASDDSGNEQGFDQVGTLTVLKKSAD